MLGTRDAQERGCLRAWRLLTEEPRPEVRRGGPWVRKPHPRGGREQNMVGKCRGVVQNWVHLAKLTPAARDSISISYRKCHK